MSRWRLIVVASLLVLPFALLAGEGTYYLWTLRWGFYSWLVMFSLMSLGLLLAWRWQSKRQLLLPPGFDTPEHWTERDSQALKLVEARVKAASNLDQAKLIQLPFYVSTAQELAQELAAFYKPGAKDPVSKLTVPEVLAVVELASHDLGELVERYVPGSHLMTIRDLRLAKQAADWAQTANALYWSVQALFNPVQTGVRFAASRMGISTPMQMLQQNLILWFYVAYVERLGHYLIEVNSGRLRIGVQRYRELLRQHRLAEAADGKPGAMVPAAAAEEHLPPVTITLLGQVKAGKSSLINALLGEQKARTDVLPMTDNVERYELKPVGTDGRLVLLDTVGFGHTGPKADQLKATQEAAKNSDILFLVLHARNPARQADLTLLQNLQAWFASRPELKPPPILAVVTHIDLLSPALEWSPPYNWRNPGGPKEENIHLALAAVREQLGVYLAGVVPVCVAPGKVYGVQEWLLPAVSGLLDTAHGVALLRCLMAEADTHKVRKVFEQMLATAAAAAEIVWKQVIKP